MKKNFIVSKIEASQDGSQYIFIAFTDPNEPNSSGGAGSPFGKSVKQYHLPLQKT
jgi:hypothetical protein